MLAVKDIVVCLTHFSHFGADNDFGFESAGRRTMTQAKIKVPRTAWVLGFVSLLMDVSSEMIHAVLPLFMVGTLGAGAVWIGLVEGTGEGTALVSKVFSGAIADRIGRRKGLVFAGYAMGVLCKPLFAVAGSMPVVLGARLLDRVGKGLRGAPRDALIAEVTPPF